MKWNLTENDGDASSITVFFGGDGLVATAEHPNFARIVEACRTNRPDAEVRPLFDVSVAVGEHFKRLSERVTVNTGKIFFDGDEVHDALATAIVNFYVQGNDDFKPLVAFMEKISTNPNEHSREHLFRWLQKHRFAICPDGDFIAYKSIRSDEKSVTSGTAIVNGVLVKGRIPNAVGTIIEMPRSEVTFDPRNGCSTGLHAGNWGYASTFSGERKVRVKINPRDVVSVPTDSSDQKLRVCRYRVLDVVTAEDRTMLYVGADAIMTRPFIPPKLDDKDTKVVGIGKETVMGKPAANGKKRQRPLVAERKPRPARKAAAKKAAAKKKAAAELVFPEFYEDYTAKHFAQVPFNDLRWLAHEWEVKTGERPTKPLLVKLLAAEARKRLRRIAKGQ